MAIPVAGTREQPDCNALSNFSMQRLGVTPQLQLGFVEAVADKTVLVVEAMVADETDPLSFTGFVMVPRTLPLPSAFVGQEISTTAGVVIGTVASVDVPTRTILFAAPTQTNLVGTSVQIPQVNSFGIPALRMAQNGNGWSFQLNAASVEEAQFMGQIMVACHVTAVLSVLPHLGITDKSVNEVVAAVLAAPDNLESLLATQFEKIELARRANQLPAFVQISGNPP